MQETLEMWVRSLGREDPLATHSGILAWKSHGQRSLDWQATVHGSQSMRHDLETKQQLTQRGMKSAWYV